MIFFKISMHNKIDTSESESSEDLFSSVSHPIGVKDWALKSPETVCKRKILTIQTSRASNCQAMSSKKFQTPPLPLNRVNVEKYVFVRRQYELNNRNTPRFLLRTAMRYLPRHIEGLPEGILQKLLDQCQALNQRVKLDKSKVFTLIDMKSILLQDRLDCTVAQKSILKALRRIFREHSLHVIKNESSQIRKDKRMVYLRTSKLFSLRCMNQSLTLRNQCP